MVDGLTRSQVVYDLLVSVKDRMNEQLSRSALIVQKNEIMNMIKWLQQKINLTRFEEKFNNFAIHMEDSLDHAVDEHLENCH